MREPRGDRGALAGGAAGEVRRRRGLAVLISGVRVEGAEGRFRLSGRVRTEGVDEELFYEVSGGAEPPSPEMASSALLAATLGVAAWKGEDLRGEDPCDAEFLRRASVVAQGLRRLHRLGRTISVSAPTTSTPPRPGRTVGASFSAGVDSFYTLWANRKDGLHPIGALVTVFGFDTKVDDEEAKAELQGRVQRVADAEGLALYCVRTNFRALFEASTPWGELLHGSLLASLALVLSGSLHTYLVPSSYPIDGLFDWGSHPLIDEAYSTSTVRIVHDAWHVHRNEKLPAIADWPLAMENLRVCLAGRAIGNCGRCEKCVRTMILLYLNDRLDAAPTFGRALTPDLVRNVRLSKPHKLQWHLELAELAERRPEHRWVRQALREAILRGRYRILKRRVRRAWDALRRRS